MQLVEAAGRAPTGTRVVLLTNRLVVMHSPRAPPPCARSADLLARRSGASRPAIRPRCPPACTPGGTWSRSASGRGSSRRSCRASPCGPRSPPLDSRRGRTPPSSTRSDAPVARGAADRVRDPPDAPANPIAVPRRRRARVAQPRAGGRVHRRSSRNGGRARRLQQLRLHHPGPQRRRPGAFGQRRARSRGQRPRGLAVAVARSAFTIGVALGGHGADAAPGDPARVAAGAPPVPRQAWSSKRWCRCRWCCRPSPRACPALRCSAATAVRRVLSPAAAWTSCSPGRPSCWRWPSWGFRSSCARRARASSR